MCYTFNVVPLSLTCPSRFNSTQTNNFTVKSVKGVFHSFDSLIACWCNDYLQNIRNSICWQLNFTALTLYRLFKNNWTHRHRFGDSCTHSPPADCASRHPLHRLVRRNFQRRRTVASGVDDQWQDDLIDCQIRKCSIAVTRSCWLSLKSLQTLHGLSRWRAKQTSLFPKPLQKF